MPAAPTPEIALPTMNATEFGAAPHMADETSKRNMLVRRTTLTG